MRNIIETISKPLNVLRMDRNSFVSNHLLEEQLLFKSGKSEAVIEYDVQNLIIEQDSVLFQAPNDVFRKLDMNVKNGLNQSSSESFNNLKFRPGYECFYASISKDLMDFDEAKKVFEEYFLPFSTQSFIIYETRYETLLILWLFLGDDLQTYKSFYGDILKIAKSRNELNISILENGELHIEHKIFHKMSNLNWQEGFVFDNEDDGEVSGVFCYEQAPMKNLDFEMPVTSLEYPHNNSYDSLILEYEKENFDELKRIQDEYKKSKISLYQKLLKLDSYEEAMEEWEYYLNNGCIPNGVILQCIDGSNLTLSDILKDPKKYHGSMFIDPFNGLPEKYNSILDLSDPSEPSLIIETGFKTKKVVHFGLSAETFILLLSIYENEYFKNGDNASYYNHLGRIGNLDEKGLRLITNYYAQNGLNIKGFNRYYLYKDYSLDQKGKVLPTEENFEKYIEVNKYELFFDPIKKNSILMGGRKFFDDPSDILNNFRKGLSDLSLNPDKMIKLYYDEYANQHKKNYLWELLQEFEHNNTDEGIEQFELLISCFELDPLIDLDTLKKVMDLLLLQLVATIDGAEHSPIKNKSCTFEYMFVFVGDGGIGKSKLFDTMFKSIGAKNYFNAEGNPDFSEKAKNLNFFNYALTEISECDEITLNKKLLENTKRIISRSEDEIYDKKIKAYRTYKRYTMFIGTTNERYYVLEENLRRFATIPVTRITEARYDVDYKKLLGYYVKKYLNGAKWWLSREEEDDLELLNKIDIVTLNHHAEGEVKLMAKQVFDRTLKDSSQYYMSTGEIWLALKKYKANETQVKRLAKALRDEGIRQSDTTSKFHVANTLYNDFKENMKSINNLSE